MIFEPKQKIKRSYYRCDSHFHLNEIIPMYDETLEHRIDGTVYVDGSECILSFVQDHRIKEVEKFDIRLISQFKNGGQSANRLARIVDENRNSFVRKVVEQCIIQFYDKTENRSRIANLIIYGPSCFKDDVYTYKKNILQKYFKSVDLITVADPSQTDVVLEHLDMVVDPAEESIINKIQEMIELADDKLEYGDSIIPQLKLCALERIVISEDMVEQILDQIELTYEPDIVIIRSSKAKTFIANFGGAIGIRWY